MDGRICVKLIVGRIKVISVGIGVLDGQMQIQWALRSIIVLQISMTLISASKMLNFVTTLKIKELKANVTYFFEIKLKEI